MRTSPGVPHAAGLGTAGSQNNEQRDKDAGLSTLTESLYSVQESLRVVGSKRNSRPRGREDLTAS